MRIHLKLAAGFGSILLIFATVGVISYLGTRSLISTTSWVTRTYQVRGLLEAVLHDLELAETAQNGYLLTRNDSFLVPYGPALQRLEKRLRELAVLSSLDRDRLLRTEPLRPLVEAMKAEMAENFRLCGRNGSGPAVPVARLAASARTMALARSGLAEAMATETSLLEDRDAEGRKDARRTSRFIAWGVGLAVVVSGLIGIALSRAIALPIATLVRGTERLVAGDFTQRVEVRSGDELGRLATSFNRMADELLTASNEKAAVRDEVERLLEARISQRTAQLEVSLREQEAFSYTIAHDLRAPLRHIDSFLGLFLARAPATLDDKSRHYLAIVSEAARKMGVLVDDLLAFARVGRVEMKLGAVSMRGLVEEAVADYATEVEGRSIEWKISALPETRGDGPMLRQVWSNLIGNALKFTRTRPFAKIEIGSVTCGPLETHFFVRDNGVGFDMKYVANLFRVFQRLHTTAEFDGVGIGLANVQRIVERHGGRAWAEAVLDGGATFWFSIPAEDRAS